MGCCQSQYLARRFVIIRWFTFHWTINQLISYTFIVHINEWIMHIISHVQVFCTKSIHVAPSGMKWCQLCRSHQQTLLSVLSVIWADQSVRFWLICCSRSKGKGKGKKTEVLSEKEKVCTMHITSGSTQCVIINRTPRLLWYNFWINWYKLAIFIHKR